MGRNLVTYTVKRLLLLIPAVLLIAVLTFAMTYSIPGNPVYAMTGTDATGETLERLKAEHGLDQPIHVQFTRHMGRLVRGDLGWSLFTRRPVIQDLLEYFPATMELTVLSMFVTVAVGVPLGIAAALRQGGTVDHLTRLATLGGVAVPVFWLGIMLQFVLYGKLGLLPVGGRLDEMIQVLTPVPPVTHFIVIDTILAGNWAAAWNGVTHMVLPVLVLAYSTLATVTRMTRSSLLEVLREQYIRTAHAVGLHPRRVIWKYAMKNALIPVLTVIGLAFGNALRGSFLVESIFDWPGMGRYAVLAILRLDYMAIIGVAVVATIVYMVVNLMVDILYMAVDPRIRI